MYDYLRSAAGEQPAALRRKRCGFDFRCETNVCMIQYVGCYVTFCLKKEIMKKNSEKELVRPFNCLTYTNGNGYRQVHEIGFGFLSVAIPDNTIKKTGVNPFNRRYNTRSNSY